MPAATAGTRFAAQQAKAVRPEAAEQLSRTELARAVAVQSRYEAKLLAKPSVVGIAIGPFAAGLKTSCLAGVCRPGPQTAFVPYPAGWSGSSIFGYGTLLNRNFSQDPNQPPMQSFVIRSRMSWRFHGDDHQRPGGVRFST